MSQAIESPQNYFAVLSALIFLMSQCVKIFSAGLRMAIRSEESWFLEGLGVVGSSLMGIPFVLLAWLAVNLLLNFPGF